MLWWPMLILGGFGIVQLSVALWEAIRWQKSQSARVQTVTYNEHVLRSPFAAAFSGMGATAYGLAGLAQLTKGFASWPPTAGESAGALLAICFMVAGVMVSSFSVKRARRLAKTGEPLVDERDKLISLHAFRAVCAVMFLVLIVRGFVSLLSSMMTTPGQPLGVFFTHLMTDSNWQTAMIGVVALIVSAAYYRNRAT